MAARDAHPKDPLYCRKEKSLGVLCTNFLKLYNKDDVESIGLDGAALQLGVERRRIYDIVNILESIGILQKKAKNQYSWKGFSAIPGALEELKEQGRKEDFGAYIAKILNQKERKPLSDSKIEHQDKTPEGDKEHRREKSLGLLTRNFIKLFLCSDVTTISLDRAALALLGDNHDSTAMRTKIRRLYDIANVFSSMDLIDKTRDPESGKPAYKWIGVGKNYEHGSHSAADERISKKRAFGTDVTNVMKRCSTNSSNSERENENMNMGRWWKDKSICGKDELLSPKRQEQYGSKDFVFGPFAPNIIKAEGHENQSDSQIPDLENLSCAYRPQYRNQAIYDLFHHYSSAWNSWHVEAEEKQKTEPGYPKAPSS